MQLEGGPLVSDWWVEMAGSGAFVPYLNVTSHLESTPDQDLLSAKGGTGFPYLVLMDDEGVVLARRFRPTSEDRMKAELEQAGKVFDELAALRKSAAAHPHDKKIQAELGIKLALRFAPKHSLDELAALAETPGLSEELVEEFQSWIAEKRFNEAYENATAEGTRDEMLAALGKAMLGLLKDGVRLPVDSDMATYYYDYAITGAIAAKDEESARLAFGLFKECLDKIAADQPEYAEDIADSIAEKKAEVDEAFAG